MSRLVDVDLRHGGGDLAVRDHPVLLPLDDEALYLFELLNLRN